MEMRKMPKRCLYIKVTKDKYELPLYVTGTAREMAKHEGTTESAVFSSISHYEHGKCNSQYRRVYLEGDE
jgi:hypothetical protein